MNENLKLICLVLRHQQDIKLSFKSELSVIYGCVEGDQYILTRINLAWHVRELKGQIGNVYSLMAEGHQPGPRCGA